jgi:hypothetical protein
MNMNHKNRPMTSLTSRKLNLMLSLQPKYCQAFRRSKFSPATNVSYSLFQFHDPTSSYRDEILNVMILTKLSFFIYKSYTTWCSIFCRNHSSTWNSDMAKLRLPRKINSQQAYRGECYFKRCVTMGVRRED